MLSTTRQRSVLANARSTEMLYQFLFSHSLLIPKSKIEYGSYTSRLWVDWDGQDCMQNPRLLSLWLPWGKKVGLSVSGGLLWADWHCPSLCHPQSNRSCVHQQWLHCLPPLVNKCRVRCTVTPKGAIPAVLLRIYYTHTDLRWEMIISIAIDQQEKVFPFCLAKDLPLLHYAGMKLESSPATEAAAESTATSWL